jgi:hypothetical protein
VRMDLAELRNDFREVRGRGMMCCVGAVSMSVLIFC